MKSYIALFLIIAAVIAACSTQNKIPDTTAVAGAAANDTVRIANDELEYEIIIIDPGFNSWLASRARPRGHYPQEYFENKNLVWVTEWNSRVLQPQRYRNLYQMRIDYNQNIDYGYEVNYLLYNYLVYFQLTHNQQLGGVVPQF